MDVAVHLAVADLLPARLVDDEARPFLPVAARERRDAVRVAVDDARVLHAERPEDPLPRKLGQRLAADARNHDAEQEVAGVAVVELDARRLVRLRLPGEREHRLVDRRAVGVAALLHRQELDVVAQAARVMHEVAKRHALRARRQLRQEFHDRIVEFQLALLLEQQEREGRELLRDRGQVEGRVRVERFSAREVGEAKRDSHASARRPAATPTVQPGSFGLTNPLMTPAIARSAGSSAARPIAGREGKRREGDEAGRAGSHLDSRVGQDSDFDSNC